MRKGPNYNETNKQIIMDREKVLETVQPLPSETAVKAWVFEVDKKFYHVATYTRFRRGEQSSIWDSNKRGKRVSSDPIFSVETKDHLRCVNEFLDTLELEKIDSGSEG
jgi:hypothetical protein